MLQVALSALSGKFGETADNRMSARLITSAGLEDHQHRYRDERGCPGD